MERSFRAVLPVYLLAAAISWPVVKVGFRLRARGIEELPEGGFVLAANHTSNFDPWPLALPLFPRRHLRFMAKSELFNPILKPILLGGGAFPVRRGEADLEAVRRAVDLVRSGEIVVMFPEGTRRRKGLRKKHEARAHTGAARIALAADAPLVPAAIKGTDQLSRLGPLRVAYGRPIPLDDLRGQENGPAARAATERLMAAIRELEGSL
ncbi:MAG: 1-acyl-sn-glycerol-3-phosphate acyltransferase [Actinobacteria bacterium]|jgi:1-acyl-sn-glycerol-3-phosphate acyltransferase|nr:MAG: 1-acyl-sn-glycerol-3-phosphate acyltransferase [Actinomycetota bacterium]